MEKNWGDTPSATLTLYDFYDDLVQCSYIYVGKH